MSRRARKVRQPSAQFPKRGFHLTAEAAALLTRRERPTIEPSSVFAPAAVPPGVAPRGHVAQDEALVELGGWGGRVLAGYGDASGTDFPTAVPMAVLATMAQRPEFWKIADTPAVEMTRRWIKVTAVDEAEDKTERIRGIEEALRRLKIRDAFRDAIRKDGLMGRGHVYIDLGDLTDGEAATPIGNGRDKTSLAKIGKGSLRSVRSIEPIWCYPLDYGTRDPLAPDWYKPQTWAVMGRRLHASRLLTVVAREVPDLLKPAYSFGGLSLTQIAAPYVENWLRARKDVSDLVHAFNVYVLSTDMMAGVQGGSGAGFNILASDGASLDARAQLFAMMASNRGVVMINKDTEAFANVTAQLSGLDRLQAQAQEQMASVASQPLVKMFGIQPTGLNASSDGEIRMWYDHCHAMQEDHLREPIETVVDVIQMSVFGDVDPSIRVNFEPLWTMSEKDRAELEKMEAETDQIHVDTGVISPQEVRQQLANDPEGRYPGLDVDDLPDLGEEESEGLEPKGETASGGLDALFHPGA